MNIFKRLQIEGATSVLVFLDTLYKQYYNRFMEKSNIIVIFKDSIFGHCSIYNLTKIALRQMVKMPIAYGISLYDMMSNQQNGDNIHRVKFITV